MAAGTLTLLVHSGSRALGTQVFAPIAGHEAEGLALDDPRALAYLEGHDLAVAWARLNRLVLAERVAGILGCGLTTLADAPHNLASLDRGVALHRKGAAVALPGALVPIAGSREADSFLVRAAATDESLFSLSHGSGRKYDRRSMHGRIPATRSRLEEMARPGPHRRVVCEDRDLLIEEAGSAYKDPERVVADLAAHGLVVPLARLSPILTFKKAGAEEERRLERRAARRELDIARRSERRRRGGRDG